MNDDDRITRLFAASLASNARVQAFQEALEKLLPSRLDGVSSREWLNKLYLAKLRAALILLENKDPELAAEVQRLVSEEWKIDP